MRIPSVEMGFPSETDRIGCVAGVFNLSPLLVEGEISVRDALSASESPNLLAAGDEAPMRASSLEEPTNFGGTGGVFGRGGSRTSERRRFSITTRDERLAGGTGVLEAGEESLLESGGDGMVTDRNWWRSSDGVGYKGGEIMGSGIGGRSLARGGVCGLRSGNGAGENSE